MIFPQLWRSQLNRRRFLTFTTALCAAAGFPAVAKTHAKSAANSEFELHVLVDFYDDLLNCYFTRKTFHEMMSIFRGWGITRVYWTGQSFASGLYDAESSPRVDLNALLTFKEVGEFIPAAAKAAHRAGMKFFVEFKPFDQYFPLLTPAVPATWTELLLPEQLTLFKAVNPWRKGIPALGGCWQMGTLFPERHPEFLMARNMTGIRPGIENEPIAIIKLVKNDAQPTGITNENLRLFVSDDNQKYRPYQGSYGYADEIVERPKMVRGVNLNRPGNQRERVRVISLTGLSLTQSYFALATTSKPGDPDFGNNYYQLAELYSAVGEAIPFTYGIPRAESDGWYPPGLADKRFPDRGFMFDLAGNLSNDFSYSLIDKLGYVDSERRLLGFAKGKNRYNTALCPAYPEVRQYWLSQVKEFIEAGADGVEFRWACHQDSLELDAYGFNQPVVEEYQRRYGVNILLEEFDRAQWRQLLVEYYTQFLREAKALLRRHGRQMMVDVMPSNDSDPARPQFLNVHMNWPEWFSFADGVSFKWVPPDEPGPDSRFRAVARKYGIPTYYNVWPQVIYKGKNPEQIKESLHRLKQVGHQGFILYEAAAFMKAKPDGTFNITYKDIPDVITPTVRAMNKKR